MRYTIQDLQRDFPDEDACLDWLVNDLNPDGITCRKCGEITKHYKVKSRRSYSCGECGLHYHPTAGTIFHNTKLPLTTWFYAMYLMAGSKQGVPATQIQRQLGVTYATAWRMMHKIRELMAQPEKMFTKEVEVDETFFHPNVFKRSTAKKKYGPTGRRKGEVVVGMVERRTGRVKVWHYRSLKGVSMIKLIQGSVKAGSTVYSDAYPGYWNLKLVGYNHMMTYHNKSEWVSKSYSRNHVQNIENFWSQLKRGIKGVYRHVSPRYLQNYANEYAFRYSYRNHPSLFWSLMAQVSSVPPSSTDRRTAS